MFRFRWGNMRRLSALLFALSVMAFAVDGPVPFVPSVEGDFAPEGFVGFRSSPARKASPGFALAAFGVLEGEADIDEFSWAAYGDLGNERWRLAFVGAYHGLDSLYRQSYSELDGSATFGWFTLGSAYGFSMEWIPGSSKWARHRIKAGVLARWRDFSFGVATFAFTDESAEFGAGVHWNPEGHFSLFAEGERRGFRVGNSLKFEHGRMDVLYGFPDFSFSAMATVFWGGWFAGGAVGSGGLPFWGAFSGKNLVK